MLPSLFIVRRGSTMASAPASATSFSMHTGRSIPAVGLGVWDNKLRTGTPGDVCKAAIDAALAAGYRHVDTAAMYGNEKEVGEAVLSASVPRDDIFVTTKVAGDAADVRAAVAESVSKLGFKPDMLLLHWPGDDFVGAWKTLEALQAEGELVDVGVSNFGVAKLKALADAGCSKPAVNQIELHPFLNRDVLLAYCRDNGIVVQAFCPLVRAAKMDHAGLVELAAEVGKSPAQVLLRWGVQKGVVVLPKSSNPTRIAQNYDCLEWSLTDAQMERLASFDEQYTASSVARKFDQLDTPTAEAASESKAEA